MDNQELLAAIRTLVREEVNASEQRMRTLVREEVNAAIYASEQRMNERLNKVEARLDAIETRLNKLEGMVMPMAEHIRLLRTPIQGMQGDILYLKAELVQVVSILDGMTVKINE